MEKELEIAKTNGHIPGHKFPGYTGRGYYCDYTPICFCKKCNAPLVFQNEKGKVDGLYNGVCLPLN